MSNGNGGIGLGAIGIMAVAGVAITGVISADRFETNLNEKFATECAKIEVGVGQPLAINETADKTARKVYFDAKETAYAVDKYEITGDGKMKKLVINRDSVAMAAAMKQLNQDCTCRE
jgi:hypothetical protein